MQKIWSFIEESVDEVKNKVTWPTWSELQSNSMLVLVASIIFAIVIGIADFAFKNLLEVIYQLS
ncbi:MAG: preprotein translocase subunit SecE [Bacteroidota bacterium]